MIATENTESTVGKYTVRRISLMPFARFGCLLGALASFIPSLICTLSGLWMAAILRQLLESWSQARFDFFGKEISLNLLEFLGLESLLEMLQKIGLASGLAGLAIFLFFSLAGGTLIGLISILIGLGYNFLARLTGGLVVELKPIDKR